MLHRLKLVDDGQRLPLPNLKMPSIWVTDSRCEDSRDPHPDKHRLTIRTRRLMDGLPPVNRKTQTD